MRKINKLGLTVAAFSLAAASLGTSAFADSRNRDETRGDDRGSYQNLDRRLRDNERVTVEGRISNMTRERDGYRVQLERSRYSFWVPERSARGNTFRVGVSIRLGGIFRRGAVYVDVIDYPPAAPNRVYVRGVVDRIDYRRDVMFVRDEFSRRVIEIDVHRYDRDSRRFDLERLRRGDRVQVWGDWRAHGTLEAYRVEY